MSRRTALTLLELLITLVVLAALAGIVVPLLSGTTDMAQTRVTNANLVMVRDAILNRYRPDMLGRLPRPGQPGLDAGRPDRPQMRYLFVNPATEEATETYDPLARKGWNGPYLARNFGTYTADPTNFTTDYGQTGDPCVTDGWGRPIVIREETPNVVLRSAGPDGMLGTDDDLTLVLE